MILNIRFQTSVHEFDGPAAHSTQIYNCMPTHMKTFIVRVSSGHSNTAHKFQSIPKCLVLYVAFY